MACSGPKAVRKDASSVGKQRVTIGRA
jgi:hypothetical protein